MRRAIVSGYKKIFTIEIQTYLFDMVKTNLIFKKHIDSGLLKTYNGSSINILETILEQVDEPSTFWLDGHLHINSYGVEHDSPIIEELKIIKNHKIKNHTILIDDMRVIRDSSWGRGYLEQEVIKLLTEINPNYKITYCDGAVPNDVLIAKIYE